MTEHVPRDRPTPTQRFMIWTMPIFTRLHVPVYRAFKGRIMNRTPAGGPVILVTTTGRHSGKRRTVALGCLADPDALYVAASNGGKASEPGWLHNIRADQDVEVQYGTDRFDATAEILEAAEREAEWGRFTAAYPDYADAQVWAGREVPLIRIPRPVAPPDQTQRGQTR